MSIEKIEFFYKLSGLTVDPEGFDYFVMGGLVYRDNFRTCESQCAVVGFDDFIVEVPELSWRSIGGKDSERLNWFDMQCESYGFEDEHQGNKWEITGPFANVRDAIDDCSKAT